MARYSVPSLFYWDHRGRECGTTGVVIKRGKYITTVELDSEAFTDLFSDADYYASLVGTEDYTENASVVDSAVRTVARLREAA
jgi:hypothetical protein